MPQIAASAGIFPWLMERRRSSSPLWLWLRLCPSSNFMRSLRWIPTLLFRRLSQTRRGCPAAKAPPMYFLVSALTCKKTFPDLEFKSTIHALCSLDNSPSICSDLVNKKLSHFLDKFVHVFSTLAGNSINWGLAVQGGGSSTIR
jgi:hypothetical protein